MKKKGITLILTLMGVLFSSAVISQNNSVQLISANTGSEGDTRYSDVSTIGIDGSGIAYTGGTDLFFDWTTTGTFDLEEILGTTFKVRIDAMGSVNTIVGSDYGALLSTAGIDRDNSGLIGVRGNTNGIDALEGIRVGLDLTGYNPLVVFKLSEVRVKYVDGSETGVIVNRVNTLNKITFGAPGTGAQVELLEGAIDVSNLGITINGGQVINDLTSVFHNGPSGNFRIVGFLFEVQVGELSGSFSYENISDHPRLLMNNSDQQGIQQAISQSVQLQNIHDYIIAQSDAILTTNNVAYEKVGKRLLAVSREALRRIFYLSYSYRMTANNQYLAKAEAELNAVCAFVDWNPSHYLDVGEMCMAVAIGYDWLYNDLQDATKLNIQNAIVTKAFNTSGGQWFLEANNNWNQVCNTGLVYGALAIYDQEKTASVAIIEQAMHSIPLALNEYGPDGNYVEGAMYWGYGTSFQVMMLAALESALGTDNGLSQYPGFMESAEYMMYMSGSTQLRFNYSDCNTLQSPKPVTFWFADKANDTSLLYEEKRLLEMNAYVQSFEEERLLPTALIFGKGIAIDNLPAPTKKVWKGNGTTPVVIVRTGWDGANEKYLGIKGGSASTSHSHMDAGSFVYDSDRYRWAMDFGMQSYSVVEDAGVDLWNMSQNSERWDVFRLNNKNHSTLSVDNQRHNVNGNAVFTEYYETTAMLGAKVDLTNTLNLGSELKSATRSVSIENESYLKVVDLLETNATSVDIYWNMVTPALAEIVNPTTIRLTQGGIKMLLEFSSTNAFTLTANRSTSPANAYEQSNDGTVMVGFDATIPANSVAAFTVTLKEEVQLPAVVRSNYIYLDLAIPDNGKEGESYYYDDTNIGVDFLGQAYIAGFADRYGWNIYGDCDIDSVKGKQFLFRYAAMGTTNINTGEDYGNILSQAGIDRASNGMLGVRGGDTNGIDPNEGYRFGLDLTYVPSSVSIQLVQLGVYYVGGAETGVIVNRNVTSQNKTFGASGMGTDIELSSGYINVEDLGISLSGGQIDEDLASIFSTSISGNFRIHGFRFKVIDSGSLTSTLIEDNILEDSMEQLQLWPNPFTSSINLNYNSDSKTRIRILDTNGRCVYTKNIAQANVNECIVLNLSKLSPGTYICCIDYGNRVISRKIIKK